MRRVGRLKGRLIFSSFFFIVFVSLGIFLWFIYSDWVIGVACFAAAIIVPALLLAEIYINKKKQKILSLVEALGLLPRPTEAYMYVISLSLLGLLLFSDTWSDISYVMAHSQNGKGGTILLYAFFGISYSIYFAFSGEQKKTKFQIEILKWYSAFFLIILSIATAVHAYATQVSGYWAITVWNGIQALALMLLSGERYVGEYIKLPERNARRVELVAGTVVVLSVLMVEKLFFDEYWAVTLASVLIVWSMVEHFFTQFSFVREESPSVELELNFGRMVNKRFLVTLPQVFGILLVGFLGFLLGMKVDLGVLGALAGAGMTYGLIKHFS